MNTESTKMLNTVKYNTTANAPQNKGGLFLSGIDYTVFGIMLSISLAIGIYFGYFDGKQKTEGEYLHGGKNMKVIPIAVSLIARLVRN